jgi:hypothetical protein
MVLSGLAAFASERVGHYTSIVDDLGGFRCLDGRQLFAGRAYLNRAVSARIARRHQTCDS